jgi:CxxC motif-containing protein (DUF1111 family)
MSASKARKTQRLRNNLRGALGALTLCASSLLSAQYQPESTAALGQAIFEKTWVAAPASTQASDGLGPHYDARSCAACHPNAQQGAYPNTLTLVVNDAVYGRQLQRYAISTVAAEAQVAIAEQAATSLPAEVAAFAKAAQLPLTKPQPVLQALGYGPLQQPVSLRLPPALAGVAWFGDIATAALQALADPTDSNGDGISGRLAGRYGWKGEQPDLAAQVAQAFSVDLGLSSATLPAAHGDCTQAQVRCVQVVTATGTASEVAPEMLNWVTAYLQSLPLPQSAPAQAEGEQVFQQWGCAACHVPTLPLANGQPLHAWSDLLLHDMGAELAAAASTASRAGEATATASEWRTAPLWGLAQRQRYLHDGRATTLSEAVLWHGGEASAARTSFINAEAAERESLLRFLRGL